MGVTKELEWHSNQIMFGYRFLKVDCPLGMGIEVVSEVGSGLRSRLRDLQVLSSHHQGRAHRDVAGSASSHLLANQAAVQGYCGPAVYCRLPEKFARQKLSDST